LIDRPRAFHKSHDQQDNGHPDIRVAVVFGIVDLAFNLDADMSSQFAFSWAVVKLSKENDRPAPQGACHDRLS